MSSFYCPYCEIKEVASLKTTFEAIKPYGDKVKCPICGAWLDVGQRKVVVNGYADIYKGALRLIDEVVEQFNRILEYCDVDLKEYFDDDKVEIILYTSDIIDKLFLPYCGGTTKGNFKHAIGVRNHDETWAIGGREDEE